MKRIDQYVFSFSNTHTPVVYGKSKECFTFVCEDCYCGQIKEDTTSLSAINEDFNNPISGLVYVEDADENDVLEIEILDIRLKDRGVCIPMENCGPLWKECKDKIERFQIKDHCIHWDTYAISWEIKPMIGVIGCAPKEGEIVSMAVGNHGGNMDCPIITKGVKVYLPIRTKGAYFGLGDLHACMADGEMCGNGLEISGEVDVRLNVIKDFKLHWPMVENEEEYYVITSGETCDLAIQRAYEEMARLLMNAYGMDAHDVSIYMSLVGSLSANQACLSANNGGNSFRIATKKIKGKRIIG